MFYLNSLRSVPLRKQRRKRPLRHHLHQPLLEHVHVDCPNPEFHSRAINPPLVLRPAQKLSLLSVPKLGWCTIPSGTYSVLLTHIAPAGYLRGHPKHSSNAKGNPSFWAMDPQSGLAGSQTDNGQPGYASKAGAGTHPISGQETLYGRAEVAKRTPFSRVAPARLRGQFREASTIRGAFRLGRPVSPEKMDPIDLIVAGSVAVTKEGARVGKGGGYSDLEYAMGREDGSSMKRHRLSPRCIGYGLSPTISS